MADSGNSGDEVLKLERSKREEKVKKKNKDQAEEITVEVTKVSGIIELKALIKCVGEVEEVGCYLAGLKGRFGSCAFIVLNVRDKIYALDVAKLEQMVDVNFWEIMGAGIFANPKLVKVCFECKDMMDYLYHRQGIFAVNLLDLKEVAQKFLEKKLRFSKNPRSDSQKRIEKSVSSLYQAGTVFLSGNIQDVELKILLEFLIPPEVRLEGVHKLQDIFHGLQVKYLFLLKRDLEMREGKFLEDFFKKRFKSVLTGSDDKALEFFRRVHLRGMNAE